MKIVGGFVVYYFHFTCVLLILLVDKFSHLNHTAQQLTRFSMSIIPSTHTHNLTLTHLNVSEWVWMGDLGVFKVTILAAQTTMIDPMSVTSQQVNSRLTWKCCNKKQLMRQKKIGLFNFEVNLKTISSLCNITSVSL